MKGIIEHFLCSKLCAGGEPGRDSCIGDSGGPMTYDGVLIGIVSWGSVNCGDAYPSIYVNVTTPATRSFITRYVTDF
jgi:trypsin